MNEVNIRLNHSLKFSEWVHDTMEKNHEPTNNGGWLFRAWEESAKVLLATMEDHNKTPPICLQCSRPCKSGDNLKCFEFTQIAKKE